MRSFADGAYLAAITLWVGGLWVIGYLVAPMLFATLGDRQLAGEVAGRLFALIAGLGLGCAGYLTLFLAGRWRSEVIRRAVFWLIVASAVLAAVQLFGIQPLIARLKAEAMPREVMESVLRDRFATWHGIASILYLVQSLLGLWLVAWSPRGLR